MTPVVRETCPRCDGDRTWAGHSCPTCRGRGVLELPRVDSLPEDVDVVERKDRMG